MKIVDVAQRSVEWFEARLGRPTASKAADVIARLKNGNPAQSRVAYSYRLVAERLSGPQPQFITAAMQRGIDEEAEAIGLYESRTGRVAETVGFGLDDSGLWGASPDALVDDGLLDVKTTAPHLFVADCLQDANGVPERFRAQMTMQCLVFDRPWCDVAQYCSPLGALRVVRWEPSVEEREKMRAELVSFCAELDELEARALEMMAEWAIASDVDAAEGF